MPTLKTLVLPLAIVKAFAGELWGTYCHNKKLFTFPNLPFHEFCADIERWEDKPVLHLRYSTPTEPHKWIETCEILLEERREERQSFKEDVYRISPWGVLDGLSGWFNQLNQLPGFEYASQDSLKIIPSQDGRLTLELGNMNLVLDKIPSSKRKRKTSEEGHHAAKKGKHTALDKPQNIPVKVSNRRPTLSGSTLRDGRYYMFDFFGVVTEAAIDMKGDGQDLEARFELYSSDGRKLEIPYIKLKGEGDMKIDLDKMSKLSRRLNENKIKVFGTAISIDNLTLESITIKTEGDGFISLCLGRSVHGEPAKELVMYRIS
ncbi:hypothetical protein FOL47_009406 [Perkinsus chesapeaki]|uniref:Uncharacterized protein n=1 Tax=Perkinsus chesapeaki TaxID=330153 RepID=A0A7J6L8L6_PERCH|nr:hypothetical protein FOL47_009406 [Perkinsus chesapeaki]